MKITDIKTFATWVGHRNQTVVKVETDEGLYGLGEAGISSRDMAVVGAIQHYREWLIGRDPLRTGALWQEMYRSQYFEGGRVLLAAQSAIDIALYDIKGKALGVPVYELLGGAQHEAVPCFATLRLHDYGAVREGVQTLLDAGWNVIRGMIPLPFGDGEKVFEPRESLPQAAAILTRLRAEVGPGPVLGLDYHHRLNVAEAASFCQRLPSGTLDFLEEPIRDESPEAYAALRRLTDVPLAIGEEWASKWQAQPYIERGLTNFSRVDICNIGGFTEAMLVAGWCEAHYIDLMPHNPLGPICSAASVHMGIASSNFAWMEVRVSPTELGLHYDHALYPVQMELAGDRFPRPTAPGLGVEFNEALALKRPYRWWEAPHLQRRDGSHTNW